MKTKLLYTAIIAGTLSFSSCELDEYNPTGGDATIESFDAWSGLETYCYSPLAEQLYSVYDFMSVAEGGTDMWLTPGGNPDYAKQLIYYDGLTTNTNGSNKVFKQAYSCIASCNAVINNADNVKGITDYDKRILTAEAKTLRAFYNLLLVTYYGPVTLSQEDISKGETNVRPVRNTVEEFYTAIIKDLTEASDELDVQPYGGNYARVCKKTALGLLARAYAQGAGEGLSENGVSYWQRAKDVADDIINNASAYNVYLYTDVSDLWAQANNRNNPEALFIVSGRDANDESYNYVNCNNNLFTYTICNPYKCSDIYTRADNTNYYLGRTNNNTIAPTKYTLSVFDPSWDKRYENTFMTAFGLFSMVDAGWVGPYSACRVKITPNLITKYGIGEQYLGQYIYPYVDMATSTSAYGGNQYYPTGVWAKGDHSGDTKNLIKDVKNVYVVDYPVAEDDDRFAIVLSKDYKSAEEKAKSIYFTVNIDDLFDGDQYKTSQFDGTNSYQLYPSLIKYDWCYNGVVGNHMQRRNGDMMVMRTAEVYLIAAEACQQLGIPEEAIKYLKPLRDRAARPGTVAPELTEVTEETILDEYAREMAGEFCRWALLKRHHKLGERLKLYNSRAARYFNEDIHYNRPISADFLNQIENKDEYGDNGYGTTPSKGY
ncbi:MULTISPECIES: RagB/SusD family nutrient uptake outer membrane protein [Prevotellaceae]|uniref:RagB/SusD family nutrient uptake outer membrane protein n=1 Tax=Xylanibacter rarus TaxID=1676614 RepID=UPI00257EB959|nr:RagB/SusD family nutrient uptake outer membrane protein [Prevotella sp.]MBS5875944.1 RagB/SusD family nutrient uptake outer membrane protein [Prevotella sp.]